jgi:hypothetical protein
MKAMPRANREGLKRKMRPELELVFCSARIQTPEKEGRIKELLAARLNWSEVLECAVQHKLAPVVYENVCAADPGSIPKGQRESLAQVARDSAKSNLAFLNEMLHVYWLFEKARIPAIPFKGPALAWLAYRNFTHRTCVDLDFVMPQRCIPEAVSLLQTTGYIPHFNPAEVHAGLHGAAPGQYTFTRKGRQLSVELHTERTLRYFSRPLHLDDLNSRTIPLEIGGQAIRTFSAEDQLVMLCVHGAKHFWERISWIADIAYLVTAREIDWPLLMKIAATMGSARLLLLGLYLAHEMIGAPLPQDILDRASEDNRVQWLARKVTEQYAENLGSQMGVFPRAIFRLQSSDGYAGGLRQLIRLSVSPTESDRQKIRLPGIFSPLYTVVRLFRLMGEYGLGLNRGVKPELSLHEASPPETVDEMLRFANVSPGDVLYDLGCGDGRIVVAAAEKCEIRAVGVDINPKRISEAQAFARRHGLEDRVQFIHGDARIVDFSEATVVKLSLGADSNQRIVDRLRAQLCSGARIISRNFEINGWAPERTEESILANGAPTILYLWTIKKPKQETAEATYSPPGASAAG